MPSAADIEVVTVWAPRPNHEKWRDDYIQMIEFQRRSALRFGHRHTVMTDVHLAGFNYTKVELPEQLMPAMIAGIVRWLVRRDQYVVFLDADALVGRDLSQAFDGTFDIGVTRRPNVVAPINNGAMYVAPEGLDVFETLMCRALRECDTHWGADQEAISDVFAPVPSEEGIEMRYGMRLVPGARVSFLSMLTHNCIPKNGDKHSHNPYVIHFKGASKQWCRQYAEKYLLV